VLYSGVVVMAFDEVLTQVLELLSRLGNTIEQEE
jgi:hypothetical protein